MVTSLADIHDHTNTQTHMYTCTHKHTNPTSALFYLCLLLLLHCLHQQAQLAEVGPPNTSPPLIVRCC